MSTGNRSRTAKSRHTAGARRPVPPIVLKIGGELLETPERMRAVGAAIAGLRAGASLIVVHGGGKEIDAALARSSISKRQIDGLRITDESTLEIVVSVLAGLVNTRLVATINAAGGRAIGLTGADAGVGLVEKAAPHRAGDGGQVDLGHVGVPIKTADARTLTDLCERGYTPIIAPIGMNGTGDLYNVNADTFAAHVAVAVGAKRLIVAGATAGVLDEHGHTIALLQSDAINRLVHAGTATAGMVAKLRACLDALVNGVREVIVANGRDLPKLTELLRKDSDVPGKAWDGYTVIVNHTGSDAAVDRFAAPATKMSAAQPGYLRGPANR